MSKLTEDDVRRIREEFEKLSQASDASNFIAENFEVHHNYSKLKLTSMYHGQSLASKALDEEYGIKEWVSSWDTVAPLNQEDKDKS